MDAKTYRERFLQAGYFLSRLLLLLGPLTYRFDEQAQCLEDLIPVLGKFQDLVFLAARTLESGEKEPDSLQDIGIEPGLFEVEALPSNLKERFSLKDLNDRKFDVEHLDQPDYAVPLAREELDASVDRVKALEVKVKHFNRELYEKCAKISSSTSWAGPVLFIEKYATQQNWKLVPQEMRLGPWIDTDSLSRWLDHCGSHHGEHCAMTAVSKREFVDRPMWLIDVEKCCIIPASQDARYVALSYVRGSKRSFRTLKGNLEALQMEGAINDWCEKVGDADDEEHIPHRPRDEWSSRLPEVSKDPSSPDRIPRTIRDAICVTKLMGEKFLWVDSLCIVQDDEDQKQEHLRCMGSIYANAYVTIVAAQGPAFEGLRGVRGVTPPLDREQANFLTASNYLHYHIKQHAKALEASIWNKRAWTFQEQIFSRRLIVFAKGQLTWECHCAVWIERLRKLDGKCQDSRRKVAQGFSFDAEPTMEDYFRHVQEYNRRELTYPEDMLDAFGGITGILSSTFEGGSAAGLPVMFFDQALLWYYTYESRRRSQKRGDLLIGLFPTWSWVAWKPRGGVWQVPELKLMASNNRSLVQWTYGEHDLSTPRALNHSSSESIVAAETAFRAVKGRVAAHLLHCRAEKSWFRVQSVEQPRTVSLLDIAGRPAGTLVSSDVVDESVSLNHFRCEVVAISWSQEEGVVEYNVM